MESKLDGSRPMCISALGRAKVKSLDGPAITKSLGFTAIPSSHALLCNTLFAGFTKLSELVPLSERIGGLSVRIVNLGLQGAIPRC
jgi:hypothetical protein